MPRGRTPAPDGRATSWETLPPDQRRDRTRAAREASVAAAVRRRCDEAIAELVAAAPDLTEDQLDALRPIFGAGPAGAGRIAS